MARVTLSQPTKRDRALGHTGIRDHLAERKRPLALNVTPYKAKFGALTFNSFVEMLRADKQIPGDC